MPNHRLSPKILAFTLGAAWGISMLFMGVANLVWPPYGQLFLEVMASCYPGYHPVGTFGSVIVGTLYAVLDGAVGGLVIAWLYNCCSKKCG